MANAQQTAEGANDLNSQMENTRKYLDGRQEGETFASWALRADEDELR